MKGKNIDLLGGVFLALIVACSAGCAKPDLSVEEVVRLRAQSWADALLANDLEGAYSLTSPTYREYATAGRYNALVAGRSSWTNAVVDSVTCSENVCTVRLMVAYEIKKYGISNQQRPLDYKWVRVEGQWWLYVSPE